MAALEPTRTAVEAALEGVLSSATFSGAPRLRRFLELVVRYILAGEEDRIRNTRRTEGGRGSRHDQLAEGKLPATLSRT